ncbi:MAG: ComF family protein [Gaiellaceae bacterium]
MQLLDLLLPERCAVCARPGVPLCDGCRVELVRLAPPVCERCGSPGPWPVRRCAECSGRRLAFTRARAALVYDDRARRIVSVWKESGQKRLAPIAASIVTGVLAAPDVDVLVPVPGDPERTRSRGRSTATGLANALGEHWSLPTRELLRRVRPLPRQRGLALRERRENVRGSVAAVGAAPRSACVIDDVYTSGSTVDACASALRRAGARRVEVVTLARAVR